MFCESDTSDRDKAVSKLAKALSLRLQNQPSFPEPKEDESKHKRLDWPNR